MCAGSSNLVFNSRVAHAVQIGGKDQRPKASKKFEASKTKVGVQQKQSPCSREQLGSSISNILNWFLVLVSKHIRNIS